jgi:hypothetical protein
MCTEPLASAALETAQVLDTHWMGIHIPILKSQRLERKGHLRDHTHRIRYSPGYIPTLDSDFAYGLYSLVGVGAVAVQEVRAWYSVVKRSFPLRITSPYLFTY